MRKIKNIAGQRFGRLVAICATGEIKNRSAVWECECDCGNIVKVLSSNLSKGSTKSCGCLAQEVRSQNGKNSAKDVTGQRFGRLVAIRPIEERKKGGAVIWECKCDCGKMVKVQSQSLNSGRTKSCGCLSREKISEIGKNSLKDITGQRFGRLVAIRLINERKNGRTVWECQCDCGNVVEVRYTNLKNESTRSCGCLLKERSSEMGKKTAKDITGQRFGRLVAIRPTEKREGGVVVWECKCDCGNVVDAQTASLIKGHKKSCGCLVRETASEIGKKRVKDITGQRFGRLVVIRRTEKRNNKSVVWECICDCGNKTERSLEELTNGCTNSCGCLTRERRTEIGKSIDIHKQFGIIENTSISIIKSKKAPKNSSTGQRGVNYNDKNGKYEASITFKHKRYKLGSFDTLEEATKARKEAEGMLYEPFVEWYEKSHEKLFDK